MYSWKYLKETWKIGKKLEKFEKKLEKFEILSLEDFQLYCTQECEGTNKNIL